MDINVGSLVLEMDFFIAYSCGLVILVLFCIERFNQSTNEEGSFVEALVPRAVSNGFQYIKAFVTYVTILFAVYTGLSIVGPHLLDALGLVYPTAGFTKGAQMASDAKDALSPEPLVVPPWVPLAILLILTGGATHFRVLNQIEFFARRLTHRLIGIPQDVERLAQNIRDRRVNLDGLSDLDKDYLIALYKQVFPDEEGTLEHIDERVANNDMLRRWLRLCFLSHMIESKDLSRDFEVTVRNDYEHVWKNIQKAITSLQRDPEQLRLIFEGAAMLEGADQKRRTILIDQVNRSLLDMHALIAVGLCPMRRDASQVQKVTEALKLVEGPIEDSALLNRVLFALIALFFGVLAFVYVAQGDPITALRWATGAFMLHGAAAISAWRYFEIRDLKNAWIPMRFSALQIPTLQYISVSVRGYLFGLAALTLWHTLDSLISLGALPRLTAELIWIPAYASVGIMTAFWVAYDFDIVHRSATKMTRRILQVTLQIASTAVVAFFITITLQRAGNDNSAEAQALAFQVAMTTGIAAAILGFVAVFLVHKQTTREPVGTKAASGLIGK